MINITLFIDKYPMSSGGMEMHADAFMRYFKHDSTMQVKNIIAFSDSQHKTFRNSDGIIVLPKEAVHNPDILIPVLEEFGIDNNGMFFFNSLYWIEVLSTLKDVYPKPIYVQRSGGNDIMQSHILSKGDSLTERRQFVVSSINSHIDTLIINSEYTRNRFIKIGIHDSIMHTVIGGVDIEQFKPVTHRQKRELGTLLNLPKDKALILSVCRIVSFKGLSYLIEAIAQLAQMYNIHHIIVGTGPEAQNIQSLIIKHNLQNTVTLVGEVPMQDIHNYYKACDIYALTPVEETVHVTNGKYIHTETMGRSFCEAISAHLPIVASDVGGIPEVLNGYNNAVLVNQKDVCGIVKAFVQILNSEHSMSATHNNLIIMYSWDNIFKQYERKFIQK